jgi:hypothetical protein
MKGVGASSKQTMLEWLVVELIDSEALTFATKLDRCEAASKVEMVQMQQKLKEFVKGKTAIELELLEAVNDVRLEPFVSEFEGFKQCLDIKLEYANSTQNRLTEQLKSLLVSFGCDPSSYKPRELFQVIYRFGKDFADTFA